MTVEEQVGTLERKVEDLETKLAEVSAQTTETNNLLKVLISLQPNPSSLGTASSPPEEKKEGPKPKRPVDLFN
jgi:hypothetical protein